MCRREWLALIRQWLGRRLSISVSKYHPMLCEMSELNDLRKERDPDLSLIIGVLITVLNHNEFRHILMKFSFIESFVIWRVK